MIAEETPPALSGLALRGAMGGLLMGLANLVPGISGGTMLLASGVYARFIEAIAEVSTFRFRLRSLLLLGVVGLAAGCAILLLAGPVKTLVSDHRWVMYSLFVGLTLGGVPLVWRMARPAAPAVWFGASLGLAVMVATVLFRPEASDAEGAGGSVVLMVGGVVAASAMILPGVSGAYMLLVLGQYERILGAVDSAKHGAMGEATGVLLPVALGVVLGIVGVSNLLRWMLRRHEKGTLGFLLGLLVGSVLGLWPFQEAVARNAPRLFFAPSAVQALGALGLVGAGVLLTLLVDRLGRART